MIYPNVVVCGKDKVRVDYVDESASLRIYKSDVKGLKGTVVADGVVSGAEITGLLQNKSYFFTVKLMVGGVEKDTSKQFERVTWVEIVNEGLSNPRPMWTFIDDDGIVYGIGGGTNTRLVKSTDGGDTWSSVYDFAPTQTRAPFVTRKGTILQALVGSVHRSIDKGVTFTKCLDFTHPETVMMNWNWAEDWDGNIYAGQYGNVRPESGVGYVNLAYLWRSSDEGVTWERIDFFVDKTDKHIHHVRVDKYTNRLYVTIGDGIKQLYYSDDKGNTWVKIGGDTTGFTGLTCVPGARIFSDDLTPGENAVWKTVDDVNLVQVYKPSPTYDTQTYSCVAFDESEIWVACNNEYKLSTIRSSLLRSVDSGLTWEVYADSDGINEASFVFMGFDRWGQCNTDFLLCSGPSGLIKIPRIYSDLPKARRYRRFPRPVNEFISSR